MARAPPVHPDCEVDQNRFNSKYKKELNSHSLLSSFDRGAFLGKGSYGEVHEIPWVAGTRGVAAVKKVSVPLNSDDLKRELDYLFGFESVAGFPQIYGCLQYKKSSLARGHMFIVQEKLYKDLESGVVLTKLRKMPLETRVQKYLGVAEALENMHTQYRLVHADLKPANVMAADEDISSIKIIDFGMTGTIKDEILGGTPIFNSPDKIGHSISYNYPHQDVWAYVLTLAVIESSIDRVFLGIQNSCFLTAFSPSCGRTLVGNVERVFQRNGFGSLTKTLVRGLEMKPTDRATMSDIIAALKSVAKVEDVDKGMMAKPVLKKEAADQFEKIDRIGVNEIEGIKQDLKNKGQVVDDKLIVQNINKQKKDVFLMDHNHVYKNRVYQQSRVLFKSINSKVYDAPEYKKKAENVNPDDLERAARNYYKNDDQRRQQFRDLKKPKQNLDEEYARAVAEMKKREEQRKKLKDEQMQRYMEELRKQGDYKKKLEDLSTRANQPVPGKVAEEPRYVVNVVPDDAAVDEYVPQLEDKDDVMKNVLSQSKVYEGAFKDYNPRRYLQEDNLYDPSAFAYQKALDVMKQKLKFQLAKDSPDGKKPKQQDAADVKPKQQPEVAEGRVDQQENIMAEEYVKNKMRDLLARDNKNPGQNAGGAKYQEELRRGANPEKGNAGGNNIPVRDAREKIFADPYQGRPQKVPYRPTTGPSDEVSKNPINDFEGAKGQEKDKHHKKANSIYGDQLVENRRERPEDPSRAQAGFEKKMSYKDTPAKAQDQRDKVGANVEKKSPYVQEKTDYNMKTPVVQAIGQPSYVNNFLARVRAENQAREEERKRINDIINRRYNNIDAAVMNKNGGLDLRANPGLAKDAADYGGPQVLQNPLRKKERAPTTKEDYMLDELYDIDKNPYLNDRDQKRDVPTGQRVGKVPYQPQERRAEQDHAYQKRFFI